MKLKLWTIELRALCLFKVLICPFKIAKNVKKCVSDHTNML